MVVAMNTAKALVAGLVVTIGLLAATFGLEAVAQLAGPEEIEEEHTEELDEGTDEADPEADGAVDEADDVELGPEGEADEEG